MLVQYHLNLLNDLGNMLDLVRSKRPLVHNITNFVVMNTTANALLALGASPIMAHAPEDLDDLIPSADAVVINIGTLDEKWVYSMVKAVWLAKELGKPVVLDPVGAGATRLRTRVAQMLLSVGGVKIVKGNLGEIAAISGVKGLTRGVEAVRFSEEQAEEATLSVSKKFLVVAAASGPVDVVSDGSTLCKVKLRKNSDKLEKLIGRVTGLGCIVSALVGAFAAVGEPLKATLAGLVLFKAVATKAAEEAYGPGSFHVGIYD